MDARGSGPILFGIGGVLWVAQGVLVLATDSSYDCTTVADVAGDILFALAGVMTALGLVQLRAITHGAPRVASSVLLAGLTLLSLGNLVEHCAVSDAWVVFVLGGMTMVAAGVALGITLFLQWSKERYFGVIVFLGTLAPGALASDGNFAAYGLAWIAFAILWQARLLSTSSVHKTT